MTIQNVKPLTSVLKPRVEVLKGRLEEAINLANIYLYNELREKLVEARDLAPNPFYDPEEFLKRTYFSEEIKNIMLIVMGGLAEVTYVYLDERGGRRLPVSKRVLVIPSALGGGKTHLLATLYHVAKLHNMGKLDSTLGLFEDQELRHGLSYVSKVLKERGDIEIIVFSGDTRSLAPTPDEPIVIDGLRIHTPWGLLGYLLGEYEKLRSADEIYKPPDVDVLRGVLRGKTVLILIDEAVEYMVKAVRLDDKYRGYSEAFLSFIRNLAMAVDETPGSVIVVTLPAEYREGVVERGYQHPEYVERVNSMLQRVAPEYYPPLSFEKDVCAVFKKRLFENAGSKQVMDNAYFISELIRDRASRDSVLGDSIKAKYGDISVFIDRLRRSYPFHPYFIELLINIALRNPSLGLTRYLLAFVARLIKYVYHVKDRDKRDPPLSLITPWVVPIEETEFRTDLLRGMMAQIQADFQRIYAQDVRSYSQKLEEILHLDRQLSREDLTMLIKGCIARTIWLSTIPGQGSKSSEVLKHYLRTSDLAVSIYDPILMWNMMGADVLNAFNELKNTSTYLSETHDNRVFYALIPDILAILRQRYLSATDFDALSKLEKLVTKTSFRQGRLVKNIIPIYTSREKEIEDIVNKELMGGTDPVLVIYLGLDNPPENIADYVLKRNNIVLLLPDFSKPPEYFGLHYTEKFRRVMGSEPPSVKEYIKSILKLLKATEDLRRERDYLREAVGEDNIDYVNKILEDLRRELEKHFVVSIYAVLRKALVGVQKRLYEVDLRPFEEEEVKDLSILSRLLEDSLEKKGVLTKWSWSDVYNQLREWSDIWDIDYSLKKPISVSDIWSQILYSPSIKPHLTGFNDFMKALEDAYRNNLVAFKHGDCIIWLKHPYTPGEADKLLREKSVSNITIHDWDRDVLNELQKRGLKLLDLEIVSPRRVVQEYINKLRKIAEVKPEEKIIRKLEVYTPSGSREFEEFVSSLKREDELVRALSLYPVVLIEEKPRRLFKVDVSNVNGEPYRKGEVREIEFERTGRIVVRGSVESDEPLGIKLSLETRDLEDRPVGKPVEEMIVSPREFELTRVIEEPGEYLVVLKAEEPGGFKHPSIPIARVRVKGEVCIEKKIKASELRPILEKEPSFTRIELKSIVIRGVLKRSVVQDLQDLLQVLGKHGARVSGEVKTTARDGEVAVRFRNTSSEIVARVILAIGQEEMEVEARLDGLSIVTLREAKRASSKLLDSSQPISSITEITIRECKRI